MPPLNESKFLEKTDIINMASTIFEDESEKMVLVSVRTYQQAAEQGDAQAQYNLGQCYRLGTGVEKDEQKAVEWYQKAAEQGDAQAQYNLGQCYRRGTGVEKDEQKAVKWYQKAAEQGDASAQSN